MFSYLLITAVSLFIVIFGVELLTILLLLFAAWRQNIILTQTQVLNQSN